MVEVVYLMPFAQSGSEQPVRYPLLPGEGQSDGTSNNTVVTIPTQA